MGDALILEESSEHCGCGGSVACGEELAHRDDRRSVAHISCDDPNAPGHGFEDCSRQALGHGGLQEQIGSVVINRRHPVFRHDSYPALNPCGGHYGGESFGDVGINRRFPREVSNGGQRRDCFVKGFLGSVIANDYYAERKSWAIAPLARGSKPICSQTGVQDRHLFGGDSDLLHERACSSVRVGYVTVNEQMGVAVSPVVPGPTPDIKASLGHNEPWSSAGGSAVAEPRRCEGETQRNAPSRTEHVNDVWPVLADEPPHVTGGLHKRIVDAKLRAQTGYLARACVPEHDQPTPSTGCIACGSFDSSSFRTTKAARRAHHCHHQPVLRRTVFDRIPVGTCR